MRTLSIFLSCFTVAATFAISAFATDSTDCKNIVQGGDNKAVPCDASKGACPAAPANTAPAGSQQKAS